METRLRRQIALSALALLLTALSSTSAHAQTVVAGQWISVKAGPATVMLYPSATSVDVGTAPVGMRFQVYEVRNGWYFVTLPKDPNERAARWGWLPAAAVEPSTAPEPSPPVPGADSPAVAPATRVPPSVPARDRLSAPQPQTPSLKTPSGDWIHRIFIGVNGGSAQPGTVTFTDTRSELSFVETRSWTAGYKVRSGTSIDVGGGVRVWRNLILGVEVSRFEDTTPATLIGTVPHPFFFNQPRKITGESRELKYTEQAVHVSASWVLPSPRWLQLTVFGGPTVFSVRRDLVEEISYSESYPYDAATFTGATVQSVQLTKTGFHVGGDISWFFIDRIGVGAVVRFARAQATLTSPANRGPLSVDLGGLQAGGGVRLRLGRRGRS